MRGKCLGALYQWPDPSSSRQETLYAAEAAADRLARHLQQPSSDLSRVPNGSTDRCVVLVAKGLIAVFTCFGIRMWSFSRDAAGLVSFLPVRTHPSFSTYAPA